MRRLFSTERSNQCVQVVRGKICNGAGFSVYHGLLGPYYRCRKCIVVENALVD